MKTRLALLSLLLSGAVPVWAQAPFFQDKTISVILGGPPAGSVPLTLSILEIISNVQLNVTAVYTATDGSGGRPAIDVEQVAAKALRL